MGQSKIDGSKTRRVARTGRVAPLMLVALLLGCVETESNVAVDTAEPVEDTLGSSAAALVPHPNCSPETQARLTEVIEATKPMLDAAIRDVEQGNDHAMIRWFGAGLDDASEVVSYLPIHITRREWFRHMLMEMRSELDSGELLRCGGDPCSDSYLGVVTHKDHWLRDTDRRIYLCPSLWDYPLYGVRNSRTDVLVHEVAHFVAGAVTDIENDVCNWSGPSGADSCYGFDNARRLAEVSPPGAETNAENYAGFVSDAFLRPALLAAIL